MLLQTLDLPRDIFRAVLADAVQQHGIASSLRLTCRSLAHECGAALVKGETACQALTFSREITICSSAYVQLQGKLLHPQPTGTLYLEPPYWHGPPDKFQHWLWQVGILQRAFPNSTLRLDKVYYTEDDADYHHLLSCSELRSVTFCPSLKGNNRFWQAIAALGRLHGSRLQLQVPEYDFKMLEAEPTLAAHVSQAALPCVWSRNASSSLADQVSSLSGITKLTLPRRYSVQDAGLLAEAGLLDALRQLSMLQSLCCLGDGMQTLLVHSVPLSWPLLTQLQLCLPAHHSVDWRSAPDLSLLEQQCPQLQALAVHRATSLCLAALTSLTCPYWEPQDTDSFQCSQLADLHVRTAANLDPLPSTLTSLSLDPSPRWFWVLANLQDQHLSRQQSLVHICFTFHLMDLADIQGLVPAARPLLAPSVTSVELTISPEAFIPPDIGGSMAGQHFRHLDAWFPNLLRMHVHLQDKFTDQPRQKDLLISHCRLVVTHKLSRMVRIVKCPSGCLSLPLSSRPADEWRF